MPWYAVALIVYFACEWLLHVVYWLEGKTLRFSGPGVVISSITTSLCIWAIASLASS